MEHAVDAQPELAAVLERLEVDVAGAVAQGLLEDLVHHADDPAVLVVGRRRVEVEDVLVGSLRSLVGVVKILAPLADGLALAVGAVERVELGLDEGQGADQGIDPQPGQELELVDDAHRLGRDEGDVEHVVAHGHRADQLVDAELLGEEAGQLLVDLGGLVSPGREGKEQVLGVEVGDLLVGEVASLDQDRLGDGRRGWPSPAVPRIPRAAWARTGCAGPGAPGSGAGR